MTLRSPRTLGLFLAALCLGLAGYFTFHFLFEKVERKVERPLSAAVGADPYYVLARYLEQRGYRVAATRRAPAEVSGDTAVLWFAAEEPVPDAMKKWLRAGGRLWSFTDPRVDDEGEAREWEATPWADEGSSAMPERAPLPDGGTEEAVGDEPAAPEEKGSKPEPVITDGAEGDDLCDEQQGCLHAAQFRVGAGCLTLVAPIGLANGSVLQGKTPARIDALLRCGSTPQAILMVYPLQSPWFGQLLIRNAKAPMLATLLLIALAVWRGSLHLGPRRSASTQPRRRLLEHVEALAGLSARTGIAPLLEGARQELLSRLRLSVPGCEGLEGDALVKAISVALQLPPEQVACALTDPPASGPKHVLAISRAMQTLWRMT